MSGAESSRSFALSFRVAAGVGAPQREQLVGSLARIVDERGLALLSSVGQELSFVVVRAENNVRAADRRAIARWAFSRSELADYRIGPLRVAGSGTWDAGCGTPTERSIDVV
ncbi:MAG TPA: hypothetical protein VJU79_04825 [Candidatus Dormibacteraeota bacterium]|nr:hypothetical protein [Candidatus Dormibacteraeota bacterium]